MVDKNNGIFYLWDTTTRTVVNFPTFSSQPKPQPVVYAAVVVARSHVELASTLPASSQGVAISTGVL